MALSSRLAIIAGGFGGIGLATGQKLQSQGAKLALLYAPFEVSRKQQVREFYAENGTDDINTYECDVTSAASVEKAFDSIAAHSSPAVSPSILINAAGYVSLFPLESTPPEETLKHLHINVLGPMLVSQAFAKLYFGRGAEGSLTNERQVPGRIVSVASQAAHVALGSHGAYCASKAALIGLSQCMASEWGPRGITANTISPGPVWTEMGKKAWSDKTQRNAYQAKVPTGRFATPEEVGELIAYLCRDDAGMINGADVRMDGGFTIR